MKKDFQNFIFINKNINVINVFNVSLKNLTKFNEINLMNNVITIFYKY